MQSAGKENLSVARLAAQQVLCLPIYPDLTQQDVERVIELISTI
jgi:dTDP-4-amino-4,6-dideoxygalactose transaminase